VTLIDAESEPLNERTDLSKSRLNGGAPEGLPPRLAEAALDRMAITRRFGERVVEIGREEGRILFDDGGTLDFDLCSAAPGASARRLGLEGEELESVETLRSEDDAARLASAVSDGGSCVVIGGGFIGLEAAAALAEAGADVALMVGEAAPGAGRLGEDFAGLIAGRLRGLGVALHVEEEPAAFEGDGRREAVRLRSGARLPARTALTAIGEALRGAVAPALVAEDAAARDGARTRHWRAAEEEGRRPAAAMLGLAPPPEPVPFFWTRIGDPLHMVGRTDPELDHVDVGSVSEGDFTRFHVEDETVVGATGGGAQNATAHLHLALLRRGRVTRAQLAGAGWDAKPL